MTEEYALSRYEEACALLPGRLRTAAMAEERGRRAGAEELRLRIGRPMYLTLPEGEVPLPQTRIVRGDLEQVLDRAAALACPATRQFCCFVGPEGTVERQLQDLAVLAEKERRQEGTEAFLDNVIMYEVLSELKEIASRPGGIACGCGSGRYGMEIRRSAVDLICRDCGAKLRVPAATDRDLDDLCCRMKLVLPGKKPD